MQAANESHALEDDELRIEQWEDGPLVDGWAITVDRVFYDEEYNAWHLLARLFTNDLGPWRVHVDMEVQPTGMILRALTFHLELGASDDGAQLLRRLRMGQAMKAVTKTVKAMPVPEGIDPARWWYAMPRPGRSGYPRAFYVEWVERVKDAKKRHGHKYWKPLLEENPGYTKEGIRAILRRAEAIGVE